MTYSCCSQRYQFLRATSSYKTHRINLYRPDQRVGGDEADVCLVSTVSLYLGTT